VNLFPDSLKKSSYEYFSYISSELKSKNEMTVITAFFDIQRDQWNAANGKKSKFSRTNDDYFEYFSRLAKIQNDLIIYTEEKFAEKILKIRSELRIAKTTVVIVVSDLFGNSLIKKMNEKINNVLSDYFRDYVYKPDSPEYNSSRYITVNALKACFVQDAIDCGYVNTDQSAWIDFGYCRSEEVLDPNITWTFDCKGKINLFHLKNLDSIPVFEVVRSGNVYIQGGHILAPNDKWIYLKKLEKLKH
jgi:protein YibB